MDGSPTSVFSPQNVQSAIPEAIGQGKDGFLTLQDRPLIAAIVNAIKEIASITGAFKDALVAWLGSAENGIDKFCAGSVHTHEICTTKSDGTEVCASGDQLAAILAGTNAGAPATGGGNGAPVSSSTQGSADKGTSTTSTDTKAPTLVVNGNNPATWPLGTTWNDNLGALFTHAGIAETVYSTSTVDVTTAGTSTIDYWAVVPTSQQVLHATRDVVIECSANDNAPAANDNLPLLLMAATGTDATSSAQ